MYYLSLFFHKLFAMHTRFIVFLTYICIFIYCYIYLFIYLLFRNKFLSLQDIF